MTPAKLDNGVSDDIGNIRLLIALTEQKRELNASLKRLEEGIDHLGPIVLEYFQRAGIQNIRLDGWLVHTRTAPLIKAVEGDWNDTGTRDGFPSWLLTVNHARLRAYIKESLNERGITPTELTPYVTVTEQTEIALRKG